MNHLNPLPEIKLISLPAPTQVEPGAGRRKTRKLPTGSTDLRYLKIREFLNSSNFAPDTRKSYERELERFLQWTELLWGEITPRHLSQYKVYLMQEVETDRGKPLAKSSINSALTALKSCFGWLSLTYPHLVATDPTVGIKFEKIPLPPAQSLTPEQIQPVWSALDYLGETKQRDTALLHVLSHGLRAGEVVGLNVGAFDGKLLFVADSKNNEPRLVPLRQASCEALQQYLSWRQQLGEELKCDRPLLLSHHVTRRGQRLSYHDIYFAIEKIGQLAGVPELHPHTFRHCYATELLLMAVAPTHARRLTGHRSEQAFRRYSLRSEQQAAITLSGCCFANAAYYRVVGEEPNQQ